MEIVRISRTLICLITLISIADEAFDMPGLTTITIPNCVTYGSNGSFAGCESLTNVTFEFGLTEISTDMFIGCNDLGSIVIPPA